MSPRKPRFLWYFCRNSLLNRTENFKTGTGSYLGRNREFSPGNCLALFDKSRSRSLDVATMLIHEEGSRLIREEGRGILFFLGYRRIGDPSPENPSRIPASLDSQDATYNRPTCSTPQT